MQHDVFNAAALHQAAAAQVPDGDFAPDTYSEALDALIHGLTQEARLTPQGTWATVGRLIQSLKKRRLLAALRAREPQVDATPIPAPIVIVGFPRTGTTLLHNLLAANPAHRAVRLWEMREPFAPAEAGDTWAEQTQQVTAQLVQANYKLAPRLADIHPLRAAWPDECSWLFRNSFATFVNAFSYYMPSYVQWLLDHDMGPDYAYYKLQLQAILAQRPGQPLVLKDPCHIWHLPQLLEVFPDARVVHLHRDVETVMGSFASLCRALHEGSGQLQPLPVVGQYAFDMLAAGMDRMLAARAALDPARFTDLAYADLVADPAATVARLHEGWGLPYDAAASDAVAAWLSDNTKLSGRHSYDLPMFGLDAGAVRDRFAPYLDRFADHLPAPA